MILNDRIKHQPLRDTSKAFSLSWTADNYKFLYLTVQGICLSNTQQIMVDMTRVWRMLDNDISMRSVCGAILLRLISISFKLSKILQLGLFWDSANMTIFQQV